MTPRVLLSAYQCGPGMGSVSQIGWEWYRRLAARTAVTLVTHSRNREALQQAGAPLPGSEVVYIDTEWFAGPLYRFASKIFRSSEHPVFLVSSLDFYVYDFAAVRLMRTKQLAGKPWDLVHQVTPVSPLASTRLHTLGLPLVLGPWNGGLASPRNFPEIMRAEAGWLYPVRKLGRLVDLVLGASRKARLILVATKATLADLPASVRLRCRSLLENGVDLDLFTPAPWPEPPAADRPLEVLFVGRLLPFKGVTMLLDAVAAVRAEGPVRLTVVGSGPEEAALHQEAEALQLGDAVRFTGALPLADVAAEMAKAHVFCLPSVRESGGAVLLEAMAAGRPVVALDYGGPSEIVDPEVGVLIPADGRQAVVEALSRTLADVMAEPETWRQRGEAGRKRVEERYSWDAKIDEALQLYRECLP
jgi:glycosyltransferase involved in cell wall biosynthesis